MSKTETTKQLEELLYRKFNHRRDFFVFECTIGWYGREIVDCISYDCNREITCYEIKQSVSDFHSKSKVTFIGNKNYYVMPYELYEKVKEEIPKEIGVYVACRMMPQVEEKEIPFESVKSHLTDAENVFSELYCKKACRRQELKADKEVILSSMLRCACRDRDRGGCFAYERGDTE